MTSDSKVQKWEECIDRKLLINRQILLIYAPWNKEAKIMDESVKNYGEIVFWIIFLVELKIYGPVIPLGLCRAGQFT